MKKLRLSFFCVIALALIVNNANAVNYTWTGLGLNTNWSNNTNWLPNTGHPLAADDATIPATVNNPTVDVASACKTFTISGTTTITLSALLTVSNGATINGNLTFAGTNSASISGASTFGFNITLAIGANNTISFPLGSTLTLGGNNLNTITNNGTLQFTSSTLSMAFQTVLTNNGTCTMSLSTINLSGNNATIANTKTFTATSTTFNLTGQQAAITNTGAAATFSLSASTVNMPLGNNQMNITNSSNATFTANNNSAINTGSFQSYISNSATFIAGTSGSACTITFTGQGNAVNPYSITNNGIFTVGSTSVINATGTDNTNPIKIDNLTGTFTFQSDANGSAAIGQLGAGSSFVGTFKVERYITGNNNISYRGYRFFSSPVYATNQTLTGSTQGTGNVFNLLYLNTANVNYPITTGTARGGFDKTGNPTIFVYREDRNPNNTVFTGGNYIGVSSITGTKLTYDNFNNTTTTNYLPVGNGFAFFFRGSKSQLAGRTTLPITVANYPDNVTVTQTGLINQGAVPVILWFNNATANNYQSTLSYTAANASTPGFNLIGNPYASTIDWEQLSYFTNTAGIYAPPTFSLLGIPKSNFVSQTYYVYNVTTKGFDTYTQGGASTGAATRYIASGQGFFVQVIPIFGSTTSITFNETAKVSAQQVTTYMGMPKSFATQQLRIKLAKDSVNTDDILFYFRPDGSTTYNPFKDAIDLGGINQEVSLSGIDSKGKYTAFKVLPQVSDSLKVKLYVDAIATGSPYSLTASGLETLDQHYSLYLIDHYKKDSILISRYKTYLFDIDKNIPASFGNDRFELVFHKIQFPAYQLLRITGDKVATGAKITWKVANEARYTGFVLEKQGADKQFVPIYTCQSDSSGTYSFIDKTPALGANIYRLRQDDVNDSTSFSPIVQLYYDNLSGNNIVVYPNPVKNTLTLSISPANDSDVPKTISSISSHTLIQNTNSQIYSIKITSITGATIITATTTQLNWQTDVSNLLPGTYTIYVEEINNKKVVGNTTFVKL
jgi:trimeric autotransporter adhesin